MAGAARAALHGGRIVAEAKEREAVMRRKVFAYLALFIALASVVTACDKSSPTEPTPAPCTYTLSSASLSFGASGGSDSVNGDGKPLHVERRFGSGAGCRSPAAPAAPENGVVNVSVTPNPTEAVRTGTLTIAGQSVSVAGGGPRACTVEISPSQCIVQQKQREREVSRSAHQHIANGPP